MDTAADEETEHDRSCKLVIELIFSEDAVRDKPGLRIRSLEATRRRLATADRRADRERPACSGTVIKGITIES